MTKRNHTFDFLCGLCIVRMVMLHTFQYTGFTVQPWWKELMDWSFYLMCFFFFKAGYFNRTTSGPTLPYLWDRTKRLLVPYITCGLIGNVLFWLFMWLLEGEYSRNPIRFLWIHTYKVSDFYGNAAMWFLFSFYIMYVAVHFIGKVRWLKWLALAFPFVSYWLWSEGNPLWMNLNNVCMGIFFFYLGHWWRLLTARTGRRTEFIISVVMLVIFVVSNVEWHGVYTMHSNLFSGNPWGAVVNTVLVVCGLSGLFLSIRLPRVPLIGYVGEHSMVYFVLHFPVLYAYRNIALLNHVSLRGSWADAVLMLVIVFAFCTLVVRWFERVPLLSGRWPKAPRQGAGALNSEKIGF
ncbi:MAG: acyltransferase family protein [Bacteroidaceae bacterium]|nr:acyltransferase family protein [Bacteroidaceae bacterium]MBR3373219.1 acyltransferase family protein [Bacteroidaceae bacterium]